MSDKERDFLDEYSEQDSAESQPDEPETEEAKQPEAQESETAEKVDTPEAETPENAATTADESRKDDHVPLAALKAEREKRQERDRELEQIRKELEALRRGQQPPEQEEEPEIWDNPDEFVSRKVQAVQQQLQGRLYSALEAAAREQYPDFDEKFDAVKAEVDVNPALRDRILAAPNPALEAYRTGKRLLEYQQMQDPDAYRQKIEAEVRAKLEAEYKAKEEERAKASQNLPPDLTASRSVKGNEPPATEDVFDSVFS